jgi:hypothetical protein
MAKRALCLPRIAFHRTEFAGADVADGVARDCDAARASDAPPALGRLPCSAADAALFDGGPRTPRHAQERLGAWSQWASAHQSSYRPGTKLHPARQAGDGQGSSGWGRETEHAWVLGVCLALFNALGMRLAWYVRGWAPFIAWCVRDIESVTANVIQI